VIAPDTSVLVAGFDSTHPSFSLAEVALRDVRATGRLIAHTIAETYAVLTARGGPYPALPGDVTAYLEQFLDHEPLGIGPAVYPAAVNELAEAGVTGGAIYDGLIGLAARAADAELVTFDRRATSTYERMSVRVRTLT
jgi:predicted nucleic acid-binding protein